MSNPKPSPPRTKKRRWLRWVIISLVVLLLGSGAGVVIYGLSIERAVTQNLKRQSGSLPEESPSGQAPRPSQSTTGVLNFVLMGSDSRNPESEPGRSDSLMVVHLNAQRNQAYIISFPRDMWVEVPGYGRNKINAASAFGGPALTVRTLEGMLKTRMDHVAMINFEGFVNLTEQLGGVTIYNKQAFSSRGFDFPRGEITISGEQALAFVRERKSLPNGDLDRAENQRNVVLAIIRKGLSGETIRNPAKFTSFIADLSSYITVDDGLTDAKVRDIALSLRLNPSDLKALQAPISGFATIGGQAVNIVDELRLRELAQALRADQMAAYLAKYPR